jgi:hypothetical protein
MRAMVKRSAGVLSRRSPRGTRTTTTYQVALGQIRPDEDAPLDALADKGMTAVSAVAAGTPRCPIRMDAALLADRPTARSVCEERDKNRSG